MAGATEAITKVLEHEGGFVNNPADKGGATNFGITQKVYEAWLKRPVTVAEMKAMPKGNAIAIYKTNYWDKIKGDQLKDYSMAYAIFDQAVNRGISAAVKQAQKVIGVNPDGIAGPSFVAAMNAYDSGKFLINYLVASTEAYKQIVNNNPSQSVFLKGWLNRIDSIKSYATAFVGKPVVKAGLGGIAIIAMIGLGYLIYTNSKARA